MPLFVEKIILPFLVVVIGTSVINPLGLDWQQRISLLVGGLAVAYFLAYTLHKKPEVAFLVRADVLIGEPLFWIGQGTLQNLSIAPIQRAAFLRITNKRSKPASIDSFKLEIRTSGGKWIRQELVPVTASAPLFMVPSGQFESANLVSISKVFDPWSGLTLQPDTPVRGWIFMNGKTIPADDDELRAVIGDDAGQLYTVSVARPKADSEDSVIQEGFRIVKPTNIRKEFEAFARR